MSEKLIHKVDTMIENFEVLKKSFKWENDYVSHLIALNFVLKNKVMNEEDVQEVKEYIKSSTGAFSAFRGNMSYCLAGLLVSGKDNPRASFDRMLRNEALAKQYKFKQQSFMPIALYTLESIEHESAEGVLSKAKDIYDDMKKNHPFLTSGDDYALAILLSAGGFGADRLESYYNALSNEGFNKSNGLQMLSHILALGNERIDLSSAKCKDIFDELKANKLKVSTEYYPALGLLSLIDEGGGSVKELSEVVSYLKKQKRYKWLGKGMLILIAAALVAGEWIEDHQSDVITTTLSVTIENIIIAQQVAMIAAVSAATTAAATN